MRISIIHEFIITRMIDIKRRYVSSLRSSFRVEIQRYVEIISACHRVMGRAWRKLVR